MTKTIQVLAQMASDASLQTEQAIEQLLSTAKVNAEQAEAIINKDITTLERQLDVRPDIVCFVAPAEDDDNEKDDSTEETNQSVIGF
jgi:hypothetical protein